MGDEPSKLLKGFNRLENLAPGAKETAKFPLQPRDLQVYDMASGEFKFLRAPTSTSSASRLATSHCQASSRWMPMEILLPFLPPSTCEPFSWCGPGMADIGCCTFSRFDLLALGKLLSAPILRRDRMLLATTTLKESNFVGHPPPMGTGLSAAVADPDPDPILWAIFSAWN